MRYFKRIKITKIQVLLVLLIIFISNGCTKSIEEPKIDVDKLCVLNIDSNVKNDLKDLLDELEKQFGITKNKMRITEDGIFIPTRNNFVEEQGYFIIKHGKEVTGKGTDPEFIHVKKCIYRYRIKG